MTDEKALVILTILLVAMTLFVSTFDFKATFVDFVPEPITGEK